MARALGLGRVGGALAMLGVLTLAGCESGARQDSLLVRGDTNATVFGLSPIYVDRPLSENLQNSLIFADYTSLLRRTGYLDLLRRAGPYTVFAVIDPAIDDIAPIYRERMTDPANIDGLRRLVGYTIVPGRFTLAHIDALLRRGGGRAGLRTVIGATLGLTRTADGHILLTDPDGRTSALVLTDIRQSNGLLYAGNRLLAPD